MADIAANNTIQSQGSIQEENPYLTDKIRLFFNTVTNDSVGFQSQITDNYVENNTAIQDHIAISPITVTLHGLCGEKVYTLQEALNTDSNALAYQEYVNRKKEAEIEANKKLGAIEVYFPQFSNATALAFNIEALIDATKQKAKVVWDKLQNKNNTNINQQFTSYSGLNSNLRESKIKEMAGHLKDAWQARKAFIVNTPFGTYENMYIQSVTLTQGNENYICDLDVTLKQLRFSDVAYTEADKSVLSKYNSLQQAQEQNGGQAKGINSVLYNSLTPDTEYINR